jgi:protein-export membrane protein SecD
MLHFPRWKSIAIWASLLVALIVALPNFPSSGLRDTLKTRFGLNPVTLGLDLQGGSNVLLEVDRKDLLEQLTQQLTGDIRSTLREAKIGYSNIQRADAGVSVRVTKPEDLDRANTELTKLRQPLDAGIFSTGVPVYLYDLKREEQLFRFSFAEQGLEAKISGAIRQSLRIVENRINSLGTTEPVIQQQGTDRIAVQMPGVQNPEQVKEVIGKTAKLTFNLLCEEQPSAANQVPPQDCKSLPLKERPEDRLWVQTSSRATVDGANLNDAQPGFGQNNEPIVTFRFNQRGAVLFGKLTAANVGKPFAIVLDDVIQSYPNINEPILGGTGQISGNFTVEETTALAVVLRSGALPAKLTIVEERTVGPSLGSDSIRAGVLAAGIGLVGIMFFIMLPYGFFGLLANVALLANLLLLVAVMSLFGFTLTLPGIAGIVLTLGMAVDSNVLIYERIREEWRNGRTALSALETGFKEALATVLDANITTLIAGAVLFGVGSGPIRGFAVTLVIGIFTTMFTAFTLTRLMVAMWVQRTRPKEINL